MENLQALYNERLTRIKDTIALKKTDRVPVCILNDMFAPKHMNVKMSDYVSDPVLSNKTILDSAIELGTDAIQISSFDPNLLSLVWLAKVKLPGVDLPENNLWQVEEEELMTVADYDVIIDKGWNYFFFDFLKNRLDNLMDKVVPALSYAPQGKQNAIDAGIVPLAGDFVTSPIEMICGARSMRKFMKDMYKIPDKVQAAFDVAMIDIIENTKKAFETKPLGVWVGGWRAASEFLNPRLWERFVWPYIKKLTEVTIEAGVIPIFHMDSNWERDLSYFREVPKGKCIFYPDGSTNIYKIKEVLGDHMCINGDVPASLLTLGTEEEVYNYSVKLIKEIGQEGFILGQGCDIPVNAKVENVKAMISAATGK
ncbi:uroporphyrinogen decarboxylase family protein [Clostridium thailandense]|uniref:uroporphyrinogen decarboxylase family protein n=1 Tax=Clostridium thailandense TaxID=2794346 RepID=UPI003988B6BD